MTATGKPPNNMPASGMPASGIPASGTPASGVPASGLPAKAPTPPFPAGNVLAVHHGAGSPTVYEPLAQQLAAGLLARRPDLADYPEETAAWARSEARAMLLDRYATQHGMLTPDGDPRPFTVLMTRLEHTAARARAALGLTPFTEAALAKERASASLVAVDLVAVAAAGREALARREAAGDLAPPDLAGEVLAAATKAGRDEWERAAAEHHARLGLVRGDSS